jgi:uncharacterized RDD family membrane protein YckC
MTMAVTYLLFGVYEILITRSRFQGTIGKIVVGVKVTTVNGKRLTVAHSFGRWLAKLLYRIPYGSFVFVIVSAITIGTTDRRLGLHDMIGRTVVIRKNVPDPVYNPQLVPQPGTHLA